MNSKLHWLLLGVWSVLLTVCILYLSTLKANKFDTNGSLLKSAMDIEFDGRFITFVSQTIGNHFPSVIHFSQEDCFCSKVADPHIASVTELAAQLGYKNHFITLNRGNNLFIPSVPAVAVIDKTGKLTYLGPYSTGMFCLKGKGIVEQFIKKTHTQNNPLGATILTDAEGCYCNLGA